MYAADLAIRFVISEQAVTQRLALGSFLKLDVSVMAKTDNTSRLMGITPDCTLDPTPSLYNTTMYCMAALLGVAVLANLLMTPAREHRHHDEPDLQGVPVE